MNLCYLLPLEVPFPWLTLLELGNTPRRGDRGRVCLGAALLLFEFFKFFNFLLLLASNFLIQKKKSFSLLSCAAVSSLCIHCGCKNKIPSCLPFPLSLSRFGLSSVRSPAATRVANPSPIFSFPLGTMEVKNKKRYIPVLQFLFLLRNEGSCIS